MKHILTTIFFAFGILFANAQSSFQKKSSGNFRLPANVKESDFKTNTVLFKVRSESRSSCSSTGIDNPILTSIFSEIGVTKVSKRFPGKVALSESANARGEKMVDLSLIYTVKYSNALKIEEVISKMLATGLFEYVEPDYIYPTTYTPNDAVTTGSNAQYYLDKIKAYTGWDISKGDTNVVVGIVDSGSDMDHPDLVGNIKKNYADPVNGTDDDGDGFVDNFRGWDLGGADYVNVVADNNPTIMGANNNHGSHVSGCASATTDNGIGVAGAGFKTKLLIVKCAADNDTRGTGGVGYIIEGYDGIVYAADHGAQIINCSWGGPGGGQFGQDIINYATFNKNALVIAAAGNDGAQIDSYPASFDNAISVASTGSTDAKSSFTNYGYSVDVCAPGSQIYSTYYNNTYSKLDGTSMASPIAAGVAAIIKAYYPDYTALQIGEQLKVTCDNIYNVFGNTSYVGRLGSGRINLYKALTINNVPSVVMTSRNITDNNDNAFVVGDTLSINGIFTNYLAATTNLTAVLTSTSTMVTVVDGNTTLGAIATLGTTDNNTDPFKVLIKSNATLNAVIPFKLTLTDGSYSAIIMFSVTVNVDYINIQINEVATTITSKGLIGYNQNAQAQGLGFTYKGGATLLYEGGLMVGTSSSAVSDVVRGVETTPDLDFQSVEKVQKVLPTEKSDFDLKGSFNDNISSTPQNLLIKHKAYAWTAIDYSKFIIVEYNLKNNGSTSLNNLYAGIFADWDMLDYAKNRASFDSNAKMGYAYSTDSSLYVGIKALTNLSSVKHYAIDNASGGGGGVDISSTYTVAQKYTTLSTNRSDAGVAGTGADIIDVISNGPFSVSAGDSVVVAFALIAGDNLTDIQTSAVNAQDKYDEMLITSLNDKVSQGEISINAFPNPANDVLNLEFFIPSTQHVNLELYNMMGQKVIEMVNGPLTEGKHQLKIDISKLQSGVYFYKFSQAEKSITHKITINK